MSFTVASPYIGKFKFRQEFQLLLYRFNQNHHFSFFVTVAGVLLLTFQHGHIRPLSTGAFASVIACAHLVLL